MSSLKLGHFSKLEFFIPSCYEAIPVAIGTFKRDENVWISKFEPILVISEDICALWAHRWAASASKQNLSRYFTLYPIVHSFSEDDDGWSFNVKNTREAMTEKMTNYALIFFFMQTKLK